MSVLVLAMQIGQETQTTESQHPAMCLCSVEEQYRGAAKSRNVLRCLLPRQNTLPCQVRFRSRFGSDN